MMTAKEAKEKAQAVHLDLTGELSKVEKDIEEYISLGHLTITRWGNISTQMREYLEALGYTVQKGVSYNGPYYSISWR